MQFEFMITVIFVLFAFKSAICLNDSNKNLPADKNLVDKNERQSKTSLKPIIKTSKSDRTNRNVKHVNFEDQNLDESIGFEPLTSEKSLKSMKSVNEKAKTGSNNDSLSKYESHFVLPLLSLIIFMNLI